LKIVKTSRYVIAIARTIRLTDADAQKGSGHLILCRFLAASVLRAFERFSRTWLPTGGDVSAGPAQKGTAPAHRVQLPTRLPQCAELCLAAESLAKSCFSPADQAESLITQLRAISAAGGA
jgi:hypothetical protein